MFETGFPSMDKIASQARRIMDFMPDVAREAGVSALQPVMDDAIDFAPEDTGALKSTGVVNEVETNMDGVRLEMSFGGPSSQNEYPTHIGMSGRTPPDFVDYAADVHDDITRKYRIGGHSFLDNASKLHEEDIPARVASRINMEQEGRLGAP